MLCKNKRTSGFEVIILTCHWQLVDALWRHVSGEVLLVLIRGEVLITVALAHKIRSGLLNLDVALLRDTLTCQLRLWQSKSAILNMQV